MKKVNRPVLSVVQTLPVNKRENDSCKLSRHQKNMLDSLKKVEDRIRRGEVRAVAVVTRGSRRSKGCLVNYGMREWEELQIMASYLESAAMKCPESADMDD